MRKVVSFTNQLNAYLASVLQIRNQTSHSPIFKSQLIMTQQQKREDKALA